MTKEIFITRLKEELKGIDEVELNQSIAFYEEAIDDRIDDGMTEDEAVRDLGLLSDIVTSIKQNAKSNNKLNSFTDMINEGVKDTKSRNILFIFVLVLASPILFSAVVTLASLIFAAFVVVFSLMFSGAAIIVTSVVTMITSNLLGMIFYSGLGLIIIGLSIMLINPLIRCVKWIFENIKKFYNFIVRWLKGEVTI